MAAQTKPGLVLLGKLLFIREAELPLLKGRVRVELLLLDLCLSGFRKRGGTIRMMLFDDFCIERGPKVDGFGHRDQNGANLYQYQRPPKNAGCEATHLYERVLAMVGAFSMPKTVDCWTSFDAKAIE